MSYFRLLWKNVGRRKARSLLTVFSIFIAFLIYGVLTVFGTALNAGVDLAGADRLVTVNRISLTQPLPISYFNKIKSMAGIRKLSYASWFGGYYQDPKKIFAAFSVDPETYLDVYPELLMPIEQRKKWLSDRRGTLVGRNLAAIFDWKVGDVVPISSNIWSKTDGSHTWEFTIDGIFTAEDEKLDTSYMLFHYDYFNEARGFGRDTIGWLAVSVDDPMLSESVSRAIDAQFENSAAETKTSTEKAFNQAFLKQLGNIGFIVVSVVSAAFFTILLIAGNTMVLALRERTGEIAVMKTLGFTNPSILALVLAESTLLALLGGMPGLGAAWLLIEGGKQSLGGFLSTLTLTPAIFLQATALMVLLGLVTGAIPAFNAMRINVVTALGRR